MKTLSEYELRAMCLASGTKESRVEEGTFITPMAREYLRDRGITLTVVPRGSSKVMPQTPMGEGREKYRNALIGEPMAEKPEAFNELPIYSFVTLTPEGNLASIYCEYYFDETIDDYTYDYCIYVKDAEGQVLLNTAEVSKALSVQLWGYAVCAAIVLLAVLFILSFVHILQAGWLRKITAKNRMHLAVILAAVLGASITAAVVVGDLNDRYIQERISKMTNMAVLMARDLDAQDIASMDSPQAYGSPAYQRIDASVQEIMDSDINEDGAYCTLYREKNGVVCIIYSDEGLNNVLYPMSGVFEGSYEAEIYETGQLKQFSAFSIGSCSNSIA